jgi:large subunit ribosomal protein L10
MATTKAKKSAALEQARALFAEAKNLILAEYRGMDVAQVTEFRSSLRKVGVKFKILKNTLMKKLAKETGIQDLDPHLHGPVGIAFLGRDIAAGSKAMIQFAKTHEQLIIKAGYLDGKIFNLDGVKAMAALPSREVMLARLLATLQAPIKGVMTVARGNTQKLVYVLNALKEQKAKA